MVITDNINWNRKQKVAIPILGEPDIQYYNFYGGSRSGKTFLICYFIRHRARIYSGSKHLIARFSFAKAKKTIWLQTLRPLLKEDEKNGLCFINETQGIANYTNGSIIILDGLEPARIDGVLGSEYETIFINEANENKYNIFELLRSRLNGKSKRYDGKVIDTKFIIDLNPTFKKHWSNLLFIKKIDPITQKKIKNPEKFIDLHFIPEDNIENLSKDYIENLKSLSPVMKDRFYKGIYGDYEGLIFDVPQDQRIIDFPSEYSEIYAGLDFGFDHPAALAVIGSHAEKTYIFDALFAKKLSTSEFIEAIKSKVKEHKIEIIYCDPSRPDYIKDLRNSGINAIPANNSVFEGIMHCKSGIDSGKVFFNDNLTGPMLEMDSYVWNTDIPDKPLKENDNFPDAFRYGYYSKHKKPGAKEVEIPW